MFKRGDVSRKRGLSPIIASVLLIMLVLVLATIIFLWARGFISEQIEKFGNPVEQQCENVRFNLELIKSGGTYTVDAINNGNVPIGYFDIKKTKGGSSEVESFKFLKLSSEEAITGVRVDIKMEDRSSPEELIAYPVLIGTVKGKQVSRPFTCVEQGKTIETITL